MHDGEKTAGGGHVGGERTLEDGAVDQLGRGLTRGILLLLER